MNPHIVRMLYAEYLTTVYPQGDSIPDEQEIQIQAAFFAGVFGILTHLERHADPSSMEATGADIEMMQAIYAELEEAHHIIVERMKQYQPEALQ